MARLTGFNDKFDTTIKVACNLCKTEHLIRVNNDQVEKWQRGVHIQHAFPHLKADDRELLISRTCGTCFDKLFGGDEE